jgi:hypothetical protein
MTINPATIAFVVAMAGIMFPAMAKRENERKRYISFTNQYSYT